MSVQKEREAEHMGKRHLSENRRNFIQVGSVDHLETIERIKMNRSNHYNVFPNYEAQAEWCAPNECSDHELIDLHERWDLCNTPVICVHCQKATKNTKAYQHKSFVSRCTVYMHIRIELQTVGQVLATFAFSRP